MIVRAGQGGTPKFAVARPFGVSLSSVKRLAKRAERGTSLAPRKGGDRLPKADETTRRLLEEDVKERPAAIVTQRRHFLQSTTGKALSTSTVGWLLRRTGFIKNGVWWRWNGRSSEECLKGDGTGKGGPPAVGSRERDGVEHLPFCPAGLVATRAAGALLGAP
jgi:transposase